jgi:CheY-like chemotaxis protein
MAGSGSFTLRARAAGPELALPPPLQGPTVVVEAIDSGSGMAAELVDKVFEPFFTTKAAGHGTGLGLSQVYGMCQRAGGLAMIDSRPGQGTTVRLLFPADDTPLETAPPHIDQRPAKTRSTRVLLVEDNAEVAASLVPLLESAGCQVTHLDRGAAALACLGSQPQLPDVLLTDVVMPGEVDGLMLARAVRQRWPALKVIVMTGYTEQLEQIAAEGLRVLPKPCSVEMLMRALEEVVAEAA